MDLILLFQEVADTAAAAEKFSLFKIISSGGILGIIIVVTIFILLAYAVYIFVERYLTIKAAAQIDENFMYNIRNNVQRGNIEAALQQCQSADSPIARMIEKGLQRIGKPLRDINTAVENVGNLEVIKLEKNLSALATISGAAPMIGFFGTVTGMIGAFFTMATQDNVSPTALAGGIYQALITTAFGLMVGIISFIGFNYLVASVQKVVFKMEALSMEFIDLLEQPA
ncbi:MAG: MotA/TolQ/ExbB proton channel family protein [Saprospiraceae bacterium]